MASFRTLNRSVFVVRPREPYRRWAMSLDADAGDLALARASVYLVPEDPTEEHETPPLEDYCAAIFALELEAWTPDEVQ